MKVERPILPGGRSEVVFLQQIGDRRRPFVFDIGAASHDRMLVKCDASNALIGATVVVRLVHGRLIPRDTDRAGSTGTERARRAPRPQRGGSPAEQARRGSPAR